MYRILVGDIALQRGEPALAARAYYEAAQDAQDATLARRATRSRSSRGSADWRSKRRSCGRSSIRARSGPGKWSRMLGQPGASGDLKGDLERLLADAAANGKTLGDAFLQLNRALSAQPDKAAVYRLISDLAKPYPGVAEAHFAVALAGYNTGLTDLEIARRSACTQIDRALELKPGWERAALVKADILAKSSPESAIRYLDAFLGRSAGLARRRQRAGAALRRAEALCRGKSGVSAAARCRSLRPRASIRRRRDLGADEGLCDRRADVCRT